LREKEKRMAVVNHGRAPRLYKSDLQSTDKKKILELFVENDEALG